MLPSLSETNSIVFFQELFCHPSCILYAQTGNCEIEEEPLLKREEEPIKVK